MRGKIPRPTLHRFSPKVLQGTLWRKVERPVKVLIKNLAIFLCPSKQCLRISIQIKLLEYFPLKQKAQRHKQL